MLALRYREEGQEKAVGAKAFAVSPWRDGLQVLAYLDGALPLLVARVDAAGCFRGSGGPLLAAARFFAPPPPGQWRSDILAGFFGEDYALARSDRGFTFAPDGSGLRLCYLAADDVRPELHSNVVFTAGRWRSSRSDSEQLTIYGLEWADAGLAPLACPPAALGARSRLSALAGRSR